MMLIFGFLIGTIIGIILISGSHLIYYFILKKLKSIKKASFIAFYYFFFSVSIILLSLGWLSTGKINLNLTQIILALLGPIFISGFLTIINVSFGGNYNEFKEIMAKEK